uniref:Sulfatase-modifying factor 1 n=1 Tax=Caligus rogercresseyi TaxID=217165 RepID=C1BMU9_CALRO|nr:Sulfatase-modifying factor 1 precursor [Caligus rogercresseyi]
MQLLLHVPTAIIILLVAILRTISSQSCDSSPSLSGTVPSQGSCSFTSPVFIAGGTFNKGTNTPVFMADLEGPSTPTSVSDFLMDPTQVTNGEFEAFVRDTGYVTEAEGYGNSFVMGYFLSSEVKSSVSQSAQLAPWWLKVPGASWREPEGPGSDFKGDHPVVHVSWNDANHYCDWAGKRLPSEAEWEYACRSGKEDRLFPWGNKWSPKGQALANIWTGDFPSQNDALDGYASTNPVGFYPPNAYGLYDMIGNVWEWTSDVWRGKSRVKKGGSFMCHKSHCYRYRCAARSQNTEDTSAHNLGFRCVSDVMHLDL